MSREIWKINKFDGGINNATDPKDIKSSEYTSLVDCNISKQGVVKTLGHAVKSKDVLPTTLFGDIIPGKGFYNYFSDYTFNPDSSIGALSTVVTQELDTVALDANPSEIFIDHSHSTALLWLFDNPPTGGTLSLTVNVNDVAITNTFNVVVGSDWSNASTNHLNNDVFYNYDSNHWNGLTVGVQNIIANSLPWNTSDEVQLIDTVPGSSTFSYPYNLIAGNYTDIRNNAFSEEAESVGPANAPNHWWLFNSSQPDSDVGIVFWHTLASDESYSSPGNNNLENYIEGINDSRFIWGLSDNTRPYYGIGYHIQMMGIDDDNPFNEFGYFDTGYSYIAYPTANLMNQVIDDMYNEWIQRVYADRTRLSLWSKIIQEINSFAGSGVTNRFEAEFSDYKYDKEDGTGEQNSIPYYTSNPEDGIVIRTNSAASVDTTGINNKTISFTIAASSLQGDPTPNLIAAGGTAAVGNIRDAMTISQNYLSMDINHSKLFHSGEMVIIESEKVKLLSAQLSPIADKVIWNIERAQLGSSAATHNDDVAISKYDIHPIGEDNHNIYGNNADYTDYRDYGTSYFAEGDQTFLFGTAGAAQVTKLYLSGAQNTSDMFYISLNGASSGISYTGPVPNSPFTLSGTHTQNASTIATAINSISGVSASASGGVITITSGTAGTAGEFSLEYYVDVNSINILNNVIRQGVSEEFTALLNKSNIDVSNESWFTNPGDGLSYKLTYFNLYSKLQNNWVSDMSEKLQWIYAEGQSGDTVTNGTFDADSNWAKGTGWSIGSGVATCDGSQSTESAMRQSGVVMQNVPGITYKITVTTTVTSGKWRLIIDTPHGPPIATNMTDEAVTGESYYLTTHDKGNNNSIAFVGSQDFAGTIDNISCRQVQNIINDPLIWDEASRLRLIDKEFRLDNKAKCFDYFDINNWFSSDYVTSWSWANNNITKLQGMEVVPNEKTWTHSIANDTSSDAAYHTTTKNGLWVGTHTDYNDSSNFDTNATMRLRFDEITNSGGIDWIGTVRFYAAAVYDDGGEGLPAHKFTVGATNNHVYNNQVDALTFGDSDGELDGGVLRVFAAIKPAANGETIFGDKRITGIRLYYTHSEEGFETFWSLGVIDFRKGFIKANEVLTVDDTTGNSNLVVWRDNNDISSIGGGSETDEGNSMVLYDVTANKVYIEFLSMPKLESFETINGYSPFNSTIDVKYKTHCIGGRRSFVGNIAVKDITGQLVYKNDTMVVSPVNQLDTFPYPNNVLDLDISDGDEIISLNNVGDKILQFKRKMLYIVDIATGIPSEFYVESKNKYKGLIDANHVVETSEGVFWFNEFGAYFYDGEEIKDLHFNDDNEKPQRRISENVWKDFVSSNSLVGYNPKTKDCFVIKNKSHNLKSDGDCYIYNIDTDSWTFGHGKFFHGSYKDMTNVITIGDNSKLAFIYNGAYGDNPFVDNTPHGAL